MTSLWLQETRTPARLPLTPGRRFDTVVVGAGLTGLVTALVLARAGATVAVLEAGRVGAGTTGGTTGKVSLLQGTRLQQIARKHTPETVRQYVAANTAALDWVTAYCASAGVGIEHRTAHTYAPTAAELDMVTAEHAVARESGLPTELIDDPDVPFPARAAVRLAGQVQLDPMELLAALALDVEAAGAPIFENTRVRGVHRAQGEVTVDTEHGPVSAETVVLATGIPILDRGGFFARLGAQRSYLAAFAVAGPITRDMFLSAGQPTRSLRYTPSARGDLLLVGGNGHPVGRTGSEQAAVDDLVDWTRRWYPGAVPLHTWSAQDYLPIGELPYAGPLLPGEHRILTGTGYAKWGLTNGVAAALALAGRISGGTPEWAAALDSWRRDEVRALPAAAKANAEVGAHLTTGWLRTLRGGPEEPPAEGEGRVQRSGVRPAAVCTTGGATHRVSAVCPHLYGIVRWNDAEKSWDCPLHGSRFAADGTLIEGPATSDLTPLSAPGGESAKHA
ncbi:FAD-dependent oxidoreductase [Nocardia harenae]|uniref:FAD-dependent oxidoreductase n=1 Tax=Nocardia harenae TaxID=358707 RepID=UPI00082E6BAE|nr:FAD-dependent oxidoreductase [Nocardia harenae]